MPHRNSFGSGRRKAFALGMISNIIGAAAALGAAITTWLVTEGQAELTQWALVLAGIGAVFVAKGTVILAIAESRPYSMRDGVPELQKRVAALESRLSSRNAGVSERLEKLEANVADLHVRN